jgi:hypothetical protein
MQTSAVEEAVLTQNTHKQEPPEAEEGRPEQGTTALVPAEPEVIEGEVIVIEPAEPSEDHRAPTQKPYWLLIPFTVLFCLVFVAAASLASLLTPSATVTIIPIERSITTTETIQVQGRTLPALTLAQSITVPATGKRHQDATRAAGTITFYNGLLTSQTVAAGTILTGSDGVQIMTDRAANIPPASPPLEGQVTVAAHAATEGVSGNIPVLDINQACCLTSVVAKNTGGFTGGRNARTYGVVTKSDLVSAQEAILATLTKSQQAALTTQLNPGEALFTPPCKPSVSSNHRPGIEAKQVTVTVSDTCTGIACASRDVYANATRMITKDAAERLGTGYSPVGDIQTTIVQATAATNNQGEAKIIVQISGTWAYQITPRIQEQLAVLLAGKTKQQAVAILLQSPGIAGMQISVRGGNLMLPQDSKAIRILVQYNAAQTQMRVSVLTPEEG